MAEKRYTAFISYRHLEPDRTVAIRLHKQLETYRIPKAVQRVTGIRRFGKVFRDEEELEATGDLSQSIKDALTCSDWLIVICSPNLPKSKWCLEEIDRFIEFGRRDHILLVLVAGTPETSFPPVLLQEEKDGLVLNKVPLAANLTVSSEEENLKRLNTEKLRLIARVLGVNFDDLKRRARARKLRIAAGITAGALALAGLAGYGIYRSAAEARKTAEQAELASAARKDAKKQKKLAEEQTAEKNRETIGKNMEAAGALLAQGNRLRAARLLLDTLELSGNAEDYRREELLTLLRRACYGQSFAPVNTMSARKLSMTDLVSSPDGSLTAGVVNSNTIYVMNTLTGEEIFSETVGIEMMIDVEFSPDGSKLLANCDDGTAIYVWDALTGAHVAELKSWNGQSFEIGTAQFLDNDRVLLQNGPYVQLSSLKDGTTKNIYNLAEQTIPLNMRSSLYYKLYGRAPSVTLHTDGYVGVPVVASPDGTKILIGGLTGEGGVIIVDTEGTPLCQLQAQTGLLTDDYVFSPDSSLVSCSAISNIFGVWDAVTGKLLWYDTAKDYATELRFSADSTKVAYVADCTMFVSEARSEEGRLKAEIDGEEELGISLIPELYFTPEGNTMILNNCYQFFIDTSSYYLKYIRGGESTKFAYIAFSGDGRFILLAEANGTFYLLANEPAASVKNVNEYNEPITETGTPIVGNNDWELTCSHAVSDAVMGTLQENEKDPRYAYSADGRCCAIIYPDGALELYEKGKAEPAGYIKEFSVQILSVAFSDRYLAASDAGGKLFIYDIESGSVVNTYKEETPFAALSFHPSGKLLFAQASSGEVIAVYPVDGGDRLFTMETTQSFFEFGFSQDGRYAIGRHASGAVVAELLLDEDELLAFAEKLAK